MQHTISFGHYGHLVLHTPHAGTLLPIVSGHPIPTMFKRKAITGLHNVLCDHYTDTLFRSDEPAIVQISFPYSRLFCDVERLPGDPLEKQGLGICYDLTRFTPSDGPFWSMSREQAMALYSAHHKALSQAMGMGGLLIDCHSFSERDNILCKDAHTYKDIDICIGYNNGSSKPDQGTIDSIALFFRQQGYRVALNKPFANAMVAADTRGHQSIMIEVNKHCYMNEQTLEVTAGYDKLHAELQQLYRMLRA